MSTPIRLSRLLPIVIAFFGIVPSAWGWGCKGHEIVALIAESHLTPHARKMALKILADSPISPTLSRYCKETDLDPFADSSTWADDERTVLPDTAPWHFIDIPRGMPKTSIARYCPPATGCVTTALAKQLAILRNRRAAAQDRADALRFIIHLVGDIHQPLHDITNNDRGGNCVPVTFFGRMPEEKNLQQEDYSPNLHGIWDTDILEQFLNGQTPQQAAADFDRKFRSRMPLWRSHPANFTGWAWETHQIAERVTYGQLPVKIAIEKPRAIDSCADDDHISTRMLHLNEDVDADYQTAAVPVVQEQLAKAGIRLAALLNSLWP